MEKPTNYQDKAGTKSVAHHTQNSDHIELKINFMREDRYLISQKIIIPTDEASDAKEAISKFVECWDDLVQTTIMNDEINRDTLNKCMALHGFMWRLVMAGRVQVIFDVEFFTRYFQEIDSDEKFVGDANG